MRKGLKVLAQSKMAKPKDPFLEECKVVVLLRIERQRAALAKMKRNAGISVKGGAIGNYEEGGILSKIGEEKVTLAAIKNIEFDEETKSLGKYDPFMDYPYKRDYRLSCWG